MHKIEFPKILPTFRRPDPRPARFHRQPLLSTRELREEVLRMVG